MYFPTMVIILKFALKCVAMCRYINISYFPTMVIILKCVAMCRYVYKHIIINICVASVFSV